MVLFLSIVQRARWHVAGRPSHPPRLYRPKIPQEETRGWELEQRDIDGDAEQCACRVPLRQWHSRCVVLRACMLEELRNERGQV